MLREIGGISSRSFTVYEKLLGDDERPGIARELARMVLPLNTYTQWYWKVDLHNLLHFLRLRHDTHAQYEIRAYAEVLLDIVRKWVPLTAAAFEEYRVDGAELSAAALAVIRRRLAGEAVTRESSGLGAGEWRELDGAAARTARADAARSGALGRSAHSWSSTTNTTGTSTIAK